MSFDAEIGRQPLPLAAVECGDSVANAIRSAVSLDFGAFCIDRIPAGSIVVGPASGGAGASREIRVCIADDTAARPRVFFFERARPLPDLVAACDGADGARLFLSGDIRRGLVVFSLGAGRGVTMAEGGLQLELTGATADFGPLLGGEWDPGSALEVRNVGDYSAGELVSGKLLLTSSRPRLAGASLRFPGLPTPATVNLEAGAEAAVAVALPSGEVSLASGSLASAEPLEIPGGGFLQIAGIFAAIRSATAGGVRVTAPAEGRGSWLELSGIEVVTPAIGYQSGSTWAEPSEPVTIGAVVGSLERDGSSFGQVAIENLSIPAARLHLGIPRGNFTIEGTGSLMLERVSAESIKGTIRTSAPNFPALAALGSFAGKDLEMSFEGPPGAPAVEGAFELSAAQLASVGFSDLQSARAVFRRPPNSEFTRFTLGGASAKGKWTVVDPSVNALISGSLNRLSAAGTVGPDPRGGLHLAVDPGSLEVEVATDVRLEARVFGAPPDGTTVGAKVSLVSPEGFAVDSSGPRGSLELHTDVLAVTKPELRFGDEPGARFRIEQPLRIEGDVALRIQLADAALSLIKGEAIIEGLKAVAFQREKVRIADLEVDGFEIQAARLEISATRQRLGVVATDLEFLADTVTRQAEPRWVASGVRPHFARVEADLGRIGQALVLDAGEIVGLDLKAERGSFASGTELQIEGTGLRVRAERLTRERLERAVLDVGAGNLKLDLQQEGGAFTRGEAEVHGFHLEVDGPTDRLNGSGSVFVDQLALLSEFPLSSEPCSERIRIRASLDEQKVPLDLTLLDSELQPALERINARIEEVSRIPGCAAGPSVLRFLRTAQ